MPDYARYAYPAPAASLVVRLIESGDSVVGFVRQVGPEDEAEANYPSEQVPAEEALRLALGRAETTPGTPVYVELGPGVTWNGAWGSLA